MFWEKCTHVLWYSPKLWKIVTQGDKMLNKLLFLFSLRTKSILVVALLSMQGQRALICVPKMNESIMGLERHEGE